MSAAQPWLAALAVALTAAAVLLLRRRRGAGLPLADAPALARPARRAAALRGGLAAGVAASLAAAILLVERLGGSVGELLSGRSSTVVVLDVSASVSDLVFREIARTLEGIADTAGDERRVGLVLFSDTALEALPPGTRAAELRPFIRYFLPKQDPGTRGKPSIYRAAGPGSPPEIPYPLSPWFRTFSGGTRISTGLAAAREALERDAGGAGSVLLVSDLAEAEDDLPLLQAELLVYGRRPRIDLTVVALPPATASERALFQRLTGGPPVVESTALTAGAGGLPAGGFPVLVALACGLAVLVVAAGELLARPLAIRAGPPAEVSR